MKYFLLLTFIISSSLTFSIDKKQEMPIKENKTSIEVDFLYWKQLEGGVDFACDDALSFDESTDYGLAGNLNSAKYSWEPGFRVHLKQRMGPDKWKLELVYGLFSPDNKETVLVHEEKKMEGSFPQFTTTDMSRATSKISFRSHLADIFLTNCFKPTNHLTFTFLNGLTGAWLKHNWNIVYYGTDNSIENHIKPKWLFKGIGPKVGLRANWLLGKGFIWHTHGFLATILGNYDNKFKYTVYTNGVEQIRARSHLDDYRLATNINFLLGPGFKKCFENWAFNLFIGYEASIWYNVHQIDRERFKHSNPQTRHVLGQLEMNGLTTTLNISF